MNVLYKYLKYNSKNIEKMLKDHVWHLILVNESLIKELTPSKKLRQKDLLTLFLFLIVVEGLTGIGPLLRRWSTYYIRRWNMHRKH